MHNHQITMFRLYFSFHDIWCKFGKFFQVHWDTAGNQITSFADIYHFYDLVRDFRCVAYRFLFVYTLYFIVIIVIYMKIPRVCVCGSKNSYRGHVAGSGGVNFYPVKIYSVYFFLGFFSLRTRPL